MKLNVYYDLKLAPVTFDFASYLVLCNAYRQSIGAAKMGITIISNQFREKSVREKVTPVHELKFRLSNILSNLSFLIPEVDSFDITNELDQIKCPTFPTGYHIGRKIPYEMKNLKQFYGKDEINLRPFRASEQAKIWVNNLFNDNVITISLRSSNFQTERNSNLEQWHKVYQVLKSLKFRPIVIPDFEDYYNKKEYAKYDWETFLPATFNVDLRLAIQERAINNLVINNGTSVPLFFSDNPYHSFKYVTPEVPVTSEKHHKEIFLFVWGDNFKWATSNQYLTWETDDADIILSALNL